MTASNLLSTGLQQGFGGSTAITKVARGSFKLTASHYEAEGGEYHDEWVSGGGQELMRDAAGQALTRTYVGNVIAADKLAALGISEAEVMTFLKSVITAHTDQIRLEADFELRSDAWQYTYKVTYRREDPYIINGIEEIFYAGTSVFVHTFGISRIVES